MQDSPKQYDYIITGAGCAGLSLVMHLIQSGQFNNKEILLVDKDTKQSNDRTWCFWETTPGLFEPIVYRKWDKLWFYGDEFSRLLDIAPYTYKLIRGIDFYRHCFDCIKQRPNITVRHGLAGEMITTETGAAVDIDNERIHGKYIFNSILPGKPVMNKNEHYLLQHFKGWVIETAQPVFNTGAATLMDFRTGQEQGTAFVYVMPFADNKALVEYTLFTKKLLQSSQYDTGLKIYIKDILKLDSYTVLEEEFGVIPMTNYAFPTRTGNIIHIGTAGGQTKPSSGYTFRFIQKHSAAIVEALVKTDQPYTRQGASRFRFYDSTLLRILATNTLPGRKIFSRLFKRNKPQQVLRFLDNETSLMNELGIISSLPTAPFLKAALRQL